MKRAALTMLGSFGVSAAFLACAQIFGFAEPPPIGHDGAIFDDEARTRDPIDGAILRPDATVQHGPFCQLHADAAICADFEDPNALIGWDSHRGDFTHVTDFVGSGVGAALARVENGSCSYGDVQRSLSGSVHGLHMELSLRPTAAAVDPVFSVNNGLDETNCSYIVELRGVIDIQRQNAKDVHRAYTLTPEAGVYSHVVVDIEPSGPYAKFTMTIDGKIAYVEDPVALPDAVIDGGVRYCGVGGQTQISVGEYCASGNQEVRVDDVLVELK